MSTLSRDLALQIQEAVKCNPAPTTLEDGIALLLADHEVWDKHSLTVLVTENAALRDQVARLTEALMAVEWSDGQSQVCQWCKSDIYEGHRMNCLRQQVLREQVTP